MPLPDVGTTTLLVIQGKTDMTKTEVEIERSASISPCGLYRYRLSRVWGVGEMSTVVMLNPSTADGTVDDPTIAKLTRYARSCGYDGFIVVNLFAWRAADPANLKLIEYRKAIGPDNDLAIAEAIRMAPTVVCAWGANPTRGRGQEVLKILRKAGVSPTCRPCRIVSMAPWPSPCAIRTSARLLRTAGWFGDRAAALRRLAAA